jgi:hypothetical protein
MNRENLNIKCLERFDRLLQLHELRNTGRSPMRSPKDDEQVGLSPEIGKLQLASVLDCDLEVGSSFPNFEAHGLSCNRS